MAFGALVSWLVVLSGSSSNGLQETPIISYGTLWMMLKVSLFAISLASFYAAITMKSLVRVKRGLLAASGVVAAGACAWTLLGGQSAQLGDSDLRILYQLIKGLVAGLILLVGAWLAFGKRAGIVVIHLGVGLLMVSEVFVGLKAVETQMLIGEGETSNFLMDPSTVELAIIDHNHPDHPGEDVVIVIPQSMLVEGEVIDDERLPFTVAVDDYFPNIEWVRPSADNPATHGLGVDGVMMPGTRGIQVREAERIVGTESRRDMPSAYITLKARGDDEQKIGTWLVSSVFDVPIPAEKFPTLSFPDQFVPLEEEDRWEIGLRQRRFYVPFEFTLRDIEVEFYVGSRSERSYEALVDVRNSADGFEQDNIKIWMNNPLRYAGYTFYQSGYIGDSRSGIETTTLQVVSNHGWMVPYLSCMIVLVGLSWQFGTSLVRFIDRRTRMAAMSRMSPIDVERQLTSNERQRIERDATLQAAGGSLAVFESIFPWIVAMAALGYLLVVVDLARVHRTAPGEFNTALFGRLPVADGGRIQPIDALARNTLLAVSDIQTFEVPQGDDFESRSAVEWLLEVATDSQDYQTLPIFRIDNDELLQQLGLEHRSGMRYSWSEFRERIGAIAEEHDQARELASDNQAVLTPYQRALVEFGNRIEAAQRLEGGFTFPWRAPGPGQNPLQVLMSQMASLETSAPKVVPVEDPVSGLGEWRPYSLIKTEVQLKESEQEMGAQLPPILQDVSADGGEYFVLMQKALTAYEEGDSLTFNGTVAQMHQLASEMDIPNFNRTRVSIEAFYNGVAPFLHAWVLSIVAFLLVGGSWLGWSEPLRRSAFWTMVLAFSLITLAIVARIYISGRPPVTNLYSSAVFIAFVGVLFGLVFECIYRNSMGLAVSTIAGILTLKVAHVLGSGGDTFAVLQPVLDTQLWLATHVVTITMGYATTYVAGLFGLMYLLSSFTAELFPHHVSDSQIGELKKNLVRMMYGTLCFALLFSFVGTVLGGLWADDSWGRFWGWDPKENGALIIVLWNALVLHARWDRIVRDRGLAALCVLGNITVSWSWFGTNALGIGLHAYGFTKGTLLWLGIFVASQVAVAGLALLPDRSQTRTEASGQA